MNFMIDLWILWISYENCIIFFKRFIVLEYNMNYPWIVCGFTFWTLWNGKCLQVFHGKGISWISELVVKGKNFWPVNIVTIQYFVCLNKTPTPSTVQWINIKFLCLDSYESLASSWTSYVASFSRVAMSPTRYRHHNCTQYSRKGLTYRLYTRKWINPYINVNVIFNINEINCMIFSYGGCLYRRISDHFNIISPNRWHVRLFTQNSFGLSLSEVQ